MRRCLSLRDVWRAQWLLATVGLTLLALRPEGPWPSFLGTERAVEFLWFAIVDFVSAGVCAACAAFLLRTPDFVAKQSGVLRGVAGLTWLGMPAWCFYLRLYGPTDARSVTPVVAGVTVALRS